MRYRLMATYQGAPYEAGVGPSDGDVVLFAACPPPEELGFEPATGHWRKQLQVQDVQALWESRPMATYRGQRCIVLDDLGDRLHIAYLGHDSFQAQQLGYWQVDRGVFELVTARDEVTDVTEERADYLGRPAIGSAAEPDGTPGYGRAAADYGPAVAGHRPAAADYGPAATEYGPRTTEYGRAATGRGPATADYGALSTDYGPPTTDFGVILPASGLAPAPAPPVPGPTALPGRSAALPASDFGTTARPGRSAALPPSRLGAVPATRDAPLPLEAAALRAASAAANPRQARLSTRPPLTMPAPLTTQEFSATQAPPATDTHRAAAPGPAVAFRPAALDLLAAPPASAGPAAAVVPGVPAMPEVLAMSSATPARRRRSARSRMATQRIFTELAALAAIPAAAYAVGEEIDGALCLIETSAGFEVFSAAGGARHEVRFFEDEESAYFYLFGVLAAEAVRTGLLIPHR
jgi:hypothetical protein